MSLLLDDTNLKQGRDIHNIWMNISTKLNGEYIYFIYIYRRCMQ